MVSQVRGRCNMCAGGCHEPRCIRSQGRCSQRLHRALGGTRILLAAVVAVAVRIHPCVPFFKADKTETPVPGSDTGVLGGRGWTSRAALLKTAHWAVFALSSATAPQLFESTLVSPFSRLIKQKLRYPLDTGVLGGRGWIARAAHLKKARRGFFTRRTVRRVDAVRIHPPDEFSLVAKQKPQRTCIRRGFFGGAKQPKSEPLPSGAALAAISSKVMVFVPSL